MMSPSRYGWVCPKCDMVHDPFIADCSFFDSLLENYPLLQGKLLPGKYKQPPLCCPHGMPFKFWCKDCV